LRRISWTKLALLVAMSIFGLWASLMVVIVFYTLHQGLLYCVVPTKIFGVTVDCATVLESKYSNVFGVPLEFLAVIYFMINLVLIYLVSFSSDTVSNRSLRILFVWRFIGLTIVVDFCIITYFLFYKKGVIATPGVLAQSSEGRT
jgi:uncharacterized membrane protein